MSTVDELVGLQEAELALGRVRARLLDIRALYAEPDSLVQERARSDSLHAAVTDLRRSLRDLEDETGAVRTKREAGQKRLYGGSVANPRELASLQAEAEALGRRLAQLEDQELDLMLQIESTAQAYGEAAERVKLLEADHAAQTAQWRQEQSMLKAESLRLEPDVAERRARLDKAALARYDTLKARKGGRATAPLRRGSCGACGVQVPTQTVQKAEQRQELVPCPSCGRILAPQ